MDKEKILEKSRAENKNQDIYEQEVLKQAGTVAVVVTLILTAVFFATQIFVGGGINYGLWALVFSAQAAIFWVKYIKLRRKHELATAILYTIPAVATSCCHIYDLITSSVIL